jgi:hypothetical protein
MTSRNYPTDITEQAGAVLEAWKDIDPALQIGGLAPAAIEADLAQARAIYSQIDSLEGQIIDLRNQRDDLGEALWDKLKRVRTGVKSIFGDDSSQYEMVGGTRVSDRKHPTRKEGAA